MFQLLLYDAFSFQRVTIQFANGTSKPSEVEVSVPNGSVNVKVNQTERNYFGGVHDNLEVVVTADKGKSHSWSQQRRRPTRPEPLLDDSFDTPDGWISLPESCGDPYPNPEA